MWHRVCLNIFCNNFTSSIFCTKVSFQSFQVLLLLGLYFCWPKDVHVKDVCTMLMTLTTRVSFANILIVAFTAFLYSKFGFEYFFGKGYCKKVRKMLVKFTLVHYVWYKSRNTVSPTKWHSTLLLLIKQSFYAYAMHKKSCKNCKPKSALVKVALSSLWLGDYVGGY